jgi:hypothetical protein
MGTSSSPKRLHPVRSLGSLAIVTLLASGIACGERAPEEATTSPGQKTATGAVTNDGGTDSATPSTGTPSPAGVCIDIALAPSELTCDTDSDCALVVTGQVCPGYVPTYDGTIGTLCYGGAANGQGVARVAAAIASVPPTDEAGPDYDFCDAVVGTPRCIARQCTICGPIPGNANHTCPQDGGEATVGDAEAD